MWLETETGSGDDPEELLADGVRIDLEMELLAEVTRMAWEDHVSTNHQYEGWPEKVILHFWATSIGPTSEAWYLQVIAPPHTGNMPSSPRTIVIRLVH
jgi:hypothetical protein